MKSVILKDKKLIPRLAWCAARWHTHYLATRRPLPVACGVYITSTCNFRCTFCNIWRKADPQTLPFMKAKALVNDVRRLGAFYFSISGGEPLLVGYLFDLLRYARQSGIAYIHVVTNGYLLDAACARALAQTGIHEVSVSIDGEASTHDQHRGTAGAYARAVKAVEHLRAYAPGIRVVLNTIFFPERPFDCFHAVELAAALGVYVKIQPLNQHPVFNRDNFGTISPQNISAGQVKEAVSRLKRQQRVINSRLFLDNMYNFFCDRRHLIFKGEDCIFGYHHIEILEDGTVFPCLEGMGWEKGVAYSGDLARDMQSVEYLKLLQGLRRCKGCQRNFYVCYYEPRINFPAGHFLRSLLRG
jgi:MoaA/NifB/PqqE/SkfB family radical SAM enzyme